MTPETRSPHAASAAFLVGIVTLIYRQGNSVRHQNHVLNVCNSDVMGILRVGITQMPFNCGTFAVQMMILIVERHAIDTE